MSDQPDNRTPEEIERDIERTRADFSSTVEAIQSKLKPSELADQAVDYVMTTTPVAYSVNMVQTVRANFMPVAMIGVGLAWLMSNRRAAEDTHYPRQQRVVRRAVYHPDAVTEYDDASTSTYRSGSGMFNRASSKFSETGRGLKGKAGEVGQRLSSSAADMKGKANEVGQRLSSSAADMKGKASEVGQRLSSSAADMTERARYMKQNATVRLQETAEEAQARMRELGQRSQEQYYRTKQRVDVMLDEQPLVVGALGIAIGAALGAALPTTRRENDLLGSKRDALLERAKETAREQAEMVKQSAQRVVGVAKEEVGRVSEVLKEEAGHVTAAVKEEAKQFKSQS